jgi:UDP-2-acetamido-2,6-beta-L-arabino-hexul-4-ose reductase
MTVMRVLITGARGFIGANLSVHLRERSGVEVFAWNPNTSLDEAKVYLDACDAVVHLAGINRPLREQDFADGNAVFTQTLCDALAKNGRKKPMIFASSTQASLDNPYGRSKRAAEEAVAAYGRETGAPVHIFRLTNVFGKWARPGYNSVVATFCHQVVHGTPLSINDPSAPLRLIYIDDVVAAMAAQLFEPLPPESTDPFRHVTPVYETTVGQIAAMLHQLADNRSTRVTPPVGTGLLRALHATYLSHLPPSTFDYQVPSYTDPRGEFVEMLKTVDCGQMSYFTAPPGVTRGEHYHHTKTEKFLVVRGNARFGFRHIVTGETHALEIAGGEGRIVETVPGWAHNVTSLGPGELIVMLWASENFDRARPDTIACKVAP